MKKIGDLGTTKNKKGSIYSALSKIMLAFWLPCFFFKNRIVCSFAPSVSKKKKPSYKNVHKISLSRNFSLAAQDLIKFDFVGCYIIMYT